MTTPTPKRCYSICFGGHPCACSGPHTIHACRKRDCVCHTTYTQRTTAWSERLSADAYATNKALETYKAWESKNGNGNSEPTQPAERQSVAADKAG